MSTKFEVIIFLIVFAIICCILLMASVPPVSRDALTHHLAIPKLYLKFGEITEIPSLEFSYYPMNLDLLYLIPLSMGNDIFPKFIHFSFALMTAWLIYWYLNRRISRIYASIGVLLFLSLPIIIKLSITVYVDLGLIFFSTLSLLFLMRWIETKFHIMYLVCSAVSCGLAAGTKYNGLILILIMPLFTSYLYSMILSDQQKIKSIKALLFGLLFFSIALLIFSPWMIRNYVWTGNPIHPLYKGNIVQEETDAQSYQKKKFNHFIIRNKMYDESIWEILLVPIRIFFQGRDNEPKYFDGVLNPILLLFPMLSFAGSKKSTSFKVEKSILLCFSAVYLLFVFFLRDMRIRYVGPIIPPLVILSIYGLSDFTSYIRNSVTFAGRKRSLLLIAFNGLFFGFLLCNILYLNNIFKSVEPIKYITGQISREEYITKFRSEYPVIKYANMNLSDDSIILSLFLGNRNYYSDRMMLFDEFIFLRSMNSSDNFETALKEMKAYKITHLLIRYDLFLKWINDNFDGEKKIYIKAFFKKYTILLKNINGYGLYQILYNH